MLAPNRPYMLTFTYSANVALSTSDEMQRNH